MFNLIFETAKALGAQNCPKCNKLDFTFGLKDANDKCSFCNTNLQKYSKEKKIIFALKVFKQLTISYDDFNSVSDKKIVLSFIDELLSPLLNFNIFPPSQKIIQFQRFLNANTDGFLGSKEKLGGVIRFDNGKLSVTYDKETTLNGSIYSLGVCLMAILYIKDLKV